MINRAPVIIKGVLIFPSVNLFLVLMPITKSKIPPKASIPVVRRLIVRTIGSYTLNDSINLDKMRT